MQARRFGSNGATLSALSEASSTEERVVLDSEAFRRMIALERKRSERSRKPFILLLLDMGDRPSDKNGKILAKDFVGAVRVHSRYRRDWLVLEGLRGGSDVHRDRGGG